MVNLIFSPQDDMNTDDAFLTNYRFIFLQVLLNDSNTFFNLKQKRKVSITHK